MTTNLDIRPAAVSDFTTVKDWLAAAGLPTEDLSAAHMGSFLLAGESSRLVGMIGLETYSDIGLLRSLIVDADFRGKGLGARLVAALETKVAAAGMVELWLLTIVADPFFARHGYEVRQRDDAPTAISNSAEFSLLCPGDAVLMSKRLGAN